MEDEYLKKNDSGFVRIGDNIACFRAIANLWHWLVMSSRMKRQTSGVKDEQCVGG